MPDQDDSLLFQACCDLSGRVYSLSCTRRNGRPVLQFSPDWDLPCPEPEPHDEEYEEVVAILCENLTPCQERTFLRLLDDASIRTLAAEEGVSRPAIYSRLLGTKKYPGGMAARNAFVRAWLVRRENTRQRRAD